MNKREIWLVGPYLVVILSSKLPSKRQVMGYLMNCRDRKDMSIKSSLEETTEQVVQVWNKARRPKKDWTKLKKKLNNYLLNITS